MIIACPACQTRYVVPDSAIGIEGRTVRCAKCKHSWFQSGPEESQAQGAAAAAVAAPTARPASAPGRPDDPQTEAAPSEPRAPVEERAEDRATATAFRDGPDFDETEPPYAGRPAEAPPPRQAEAEPAGSSFDRRPPFRPRRNHVRLWTWAASVFAVLAVGTIAVVNYTGLPGWFPINRPLFGVAQPDLELRFPVEEQERRTLPNGTEFFGARIIVSNTARESRDIPPILIVLRDQQERIVFSWVVTPEQSTLAPGEELTINEAVTDVPKSAVFADIGWAPR